MIYINLNEEVSDMFTVMDEDGTPITGLTKGNFTCYLTNPNGTDVTDILGIDEINHGRYFGTFTPNMVGPWVLIIYHDPYLLTGAEESYYCQETDFDEINTAISSVSSSVNTANNTLNTVHDKINIIDTVVDGNNTKIDIIDDIVDDIYADTLLTKGSVLSIYNKLPTQKIMGSSTNESMDDEITAIKINTDNFPANLTGEFTTLNIKLDAIGIKVDSINVYADLHQMVDQHVFVNERLTYARERYATDEAFTDVKYTYIYTASYDIYGKLIEAKKTVQE